MRQIWQRNDTLGVTPIPAFGPHSGRLSGVDIRVRLWRLGEQRIVTRDEEFELDKTFTDERGDIYVMKSIDGGGTVNAEWTGESGKVLPP
ncbi:MAG TPA: hypothetical protein VK821_12765 [Dehalococcoidia bacterium]|nr:hypothetical protein [Dehalococcoidia bacterium]